MRQSRKPLKDKHGHELDNTTTKTIGDKGKQAWCPACYEYMPVVPAKPRPTSVPPTPEF